MVDRMHLHGKAVNMASHFEIDGVIDPKDSRHWITRAIESAPRPEARTGKKRPFIDTWWSFGRTDRSPGERESDIGLWSWRWLRGIAYPARWPGTGSIERPREPHP
jgi:hypothetical protein